MNSSPSGVSRGTGVSATPGQHVLGKLATSFGERLPLGLHQMRGTLASDGCPVDCRELDDVVRYYRSQGATVPFRIVRFGGTEIAVAPAQARLAAQVGAAAVRMVQHWGIVSAPALTDRTEIVSTSIIPRIFVEKILGALPATRWLDGPGAGREWFSFAGRASGLSEALDKVLSLGRTISVAELRAALGRSSTALMEAPLAVFQRYLTDVGACAVEQGRVVRVPAPAEGNVLSRPEATLVRLLRASGGQLAPSTLRRRAAEAALSDATLTRLLRFSPLVSRTANDAICLAGSDAPVQDSHSLPQTAAPERRRPAGTDTLS